MSDRTQIFVSKNVTVFNVETPLRFVYNNHQNICYVFWNKWMTTFWKLSIFIQWYWQQWNIFKKHMKSI